MALFNKELMDLRWRFLTLLILLLGAAYLVLGHYELFKSMINIQDIQNSMTQAPWLERFYKGEDIARQLQELMQNQALYVWSQWFGKNLLQLVLLAVILFGFSSLAREREQGTLSFLMANFSRKAIFINKISAGLTATIIFCVLGSALPAIMAPFYDFSFTPLQALQYGLHLTAAAIFLYAVVLMLSIISADVIRPIIGSILIFAVLSIPGRIAALQNLYIYRYMAGTDLFFTGHVQWLAILILLVLSAIIICASWKYYEQADIS